MKRALHPILILIIVLNTHSASGQPFNDNWGSPSSLPFPIWTSGNNINATTQPLEQDLGITGATVWWFFFAEVNGTVTINTFGSDYDTVLHVYTDFQNGFGNFTLVAANDDTGGLQSQVTFPVSAGRYYEIRVGGFNGAQGNISLTGSPTPPNDNWSSGGLFLFLPFFTEGTNVGATVQPFEQDLIAPPTDATVWWWTAAPGDGTVTIDTFGSDYDTVLHVYKDIINGFGNFTLVAANDDFGGLQSQVTFPVNAGQNYEIRVGGYFGLMGLIDMTGTFMPDGVLLGDVNLDGIVNLLDVTPFVNLVTGGGFQLEADINGDGLVNLLDVTPFIAILTG